MSLVEFKRGHGVFATAEIKADAVICYFDGYVKTKGEETPQEQHLALDITQEEFLVGWLVPKTEMGIGQHIRDVTPPRFEVDPKAALVVEVCHLRDELCAYLDRRAEANVLRDAIDVSSKTRINIIASRDIAKGEELRLVFGAHYWFERHLRQKPTIHLLLLEGIFNNTYERVIEHLTKEMGEGIKAMAVTDICATVDAMITVTLRAYEMTGMQKFVNAVDVVALQEKIRTSRERLVVRF
jgi:hypothetical protein